MPRPEPHDTFDSPSNSILADAYASSERPLARLEKPVHDDGANETQEDSADGGAPPSGERAPWQRDVRRWLATLNPGQTQREYEKAVGYFFTTPGVPQSPAELTFDLLLAYRGALAMRATAHAEIHSRRLASRGPRLDAARWPALEGEALEDAAGSDGAEPSRRRARTAHHDGPLAPATVNLRLTALRQFLVHCALYGSVSQLSPDRIRAALTRLSIERRRPYQVLSEPEWSAFLEAARLPMKTPSHQAGERETAEHPPRSPEKPERSPWGVPRSVRLRQQMEHAEREPSAEGQETRGPSTNTTLDGSARRLPHSSAGLTGARTAQRDHALISLALATGLRAIELASLDLGDLSREWLAGREEWWLVLPDKKTKGQRGGRVLPLDAELMRTILAYVETTGRRWERPRDRATPLFLSGSLHVEGRRSRKKTAAGNTGIGDGRTSGRLSPNSIRRIVDRVESQWLAMRAGETGEVEDDDEIAGEARHISPHALRHSTAIALLEGNDAAGRPPASVEHVRGWLGHFDIRTTQGYLAHLEGRKHRRPFTLTPGGGATHDETTGVGPRGETDS